MGHGIDAYKQLVNENRQAQSENQVIGRDKERHIVWRQPDNPPGHWTKFLGALYGKGLFTGNRSVREAYGRVTGYANRLGAFQTESRKVMTGFMRALRTEYGDTAMAKIERGLHLTATTPLTARLVRKALDTAEGLRTHHQHWNELSLRFFMDTSTFGGLARAGKDDMTFIKCMRANGVKCTGKETSWKECFPPETAKWVESFMALRVKEHPDFGKRMLTNDELTRFATEALAVVKEAKAPETSSKELRARIFQRACQGAKTADELLFLARKGIVCDLTVRPKLNPDVIFSKIREVGNRVARDLGKRPLPEELLKTIGENVSSEVEARYAEILKTLETGESADAIAEQLLPALLGHIETLLRDHYTALDRVQGSEVLTEGQKAELGRLAQTRRLDPVQVQAFERFSVLFRMECPLLLHSLTNQDAIGYSRAMHDLYQFFDACLPEVALHGATHLESGSVSSPEGVRELLGDMMRVAVADADSTARNTLFSSLVSGQAQNILAGFRHSEDPRISKGIPLLHEALARGAGTMTGLGTDDIDRMSSDLFLDVPVTGIRPLSLLVASGSEEERGCVNPKCKHAHLIPENYSPRQFSMGHAREAVDYVKNLPLDPKTHLAEQMLKDIGRNLYYINGELISGPDNKTIQRSTELFLKPFERDGVVDMELAQTVSRCMNQSGVENPNIQLQTAFGGQTVGEGERPSQTDSEAWRDEEGNWYVRNTTKLNVAMLQMPDGEPEPLEEGSYLLSTTTFKISAESIALHTPEIEMVDSRTYFDF